MNTLPLELKLKIMEIYHVNYGIKSLIKSFREINKDFVEYVDYFIKSKLKNYSFSKILKIHKNMPSVRNGQGTIKNMRNIIKKLPSFCKLHLIEFYSFIINQYDYSDPIISELLDQVELEVSNFHSKLYPNDKLQDISCKITKIIAYLISEKYFTLHKDLLQLPTTEIYTIEVTAEKHTNIVLRWSPQFGGINVLQRSRFVRDYGDDGAMLEGNITNINQVLLTEDILNRLKSMNNPSGFSKILKIRIIQYLYNENNVTVDNIMNHNFEKYY